MHLPVCIFYISILFLSFLLVLFQHFAQDFTFDVFLRQQWIDQRLDHETNQTLYLSNHANDLIWIPDTYFVNAKNGEMHDVTSSNVMIMLAPGGLVKYNARYA